MHTDKTLQIKRANCVWTLPTVISNGTFPNSKRIIQVLNRKGYINAPKVYVDFDFHCAVLLYTVWGYKYIPVHVCAVTVYG